MAILLDFMLNYFSFCKICKYKKNKKNIYEMYNVRKIDNYTLTSKKTLFML